MTDPTPTRADWETLVAHNKALIDRNVALRERAEVAESKAYDWESQSEAHFDAWRAAKRRFEAAEARLEIIECQSFSGGYEAGQRDADAALTARLDAEWNAAYLAGFMASGEGWNGEYPFSDRGKRPDDQDHWLDDRDEARTLRRAAPTEGEA